MTDISQQGADDADNVVAGDAPRWRNWLWLTLSLAAAGSIMLWLAVVLIDPFSTGRFALTQRIDMTTTNARLGDAALVRDPRFNGAIFGDSVAATLDPRSAAGHSNWRLASLAIYAAGASEVVAVANAYESHHREGRTLEIFILSNRWCVTEPNALNGPVPFPQWLYASSDADYLSRLLSPDAVTSALMRAGIWLGLAKPAARPDGYTGQTFGRLVSAFHDQRPSQGPSPSAPFPAIDVLAAHITALPHNRAIAVVFAPLHVSILPVAGSAAAARLDACKQRLREVTARRPHAAFLDMMIESPLTEAEANYSDPLHLHPQGLPQFEAAIAQAIDASGIRPE